MVPPVDLPGQVGPVELGDDDAEFWGRMWGSAAASAGLWNDPAFFEVLVGVVVLRRLWMVEPSAARAKDYRDAADKVGLTPEGARKFRLELDDADVAAVEPKKPKGKPATKSLRVV